MFCDQCGTQFGPGQLYCSRCGKKFVGPMSQIPQARVREHIRLLSILWMAFDKSEGVVKGTRMRSGV
jgi:predicted amidophosphoribosyltransferase